MTLNIILNLIMGLWFNNKMNRMFRENNVKAQTENANTTKTSKFKYGNLIKEQEKYDATKQYFRYWTLSSEEYDDTIKDENGIALKANDNKYVYNPVIIAQYGLKEYSIYINSGNEENYKMANKQADYLLDIQDKKSGNFYYNYDFKVGGTNETMKAPWTSAMAQGQVISLFSRIYYISKEEKYLQAAKHAMIPLTKK